MDPDRRLSDSALILGALFVACTTIAVGYFADPFATERTAAAWNRSLLAATTYPGTPTTPATQTQQTSLLRCLDKNSGEITKSECRPGCVYDIQMPKWGATGVVKATPEFSNPKGPQGIVKYHGSVSLFGLGDHTYTCASGAKPPTIGDTLLANGNRDLISGTFRFQVEEASTPLSSVLNNAPANTSQTGLNAHTAPTSQTSPYIYDRGQSVYPGGSDPWQQNWSAPATQPNYTECIGCTKETLSGGIGQYNSTNLPNPVDSESAAGAGSVPGIVSPGPAQGSLQGVPRGIPGDIVETPYSRSDQQLLPANPDPTITITKPDGTVWREYLFPNGEVYLVSQNGEISIPNPNPEAALELPPSGAHATVQPATPAAPAVTAQPTTPATPQSSGSVLPTPRMPNQAIVSNTAIDASVGNWVPCEIISIRQPFSYTWVGTTVCHDY